METILGFTLEDARRLAVVRALVLTIEKDACELVATNATCKAYPEVLKGLRDVLETFKALRKDCPRAMASEQCWDDYDRCEDGVCRPWCS